MHRTVDANQDRAQADHMNSDERAPSRSDAAAEPRPAPSSAASAENSQEPPAPPWWKFWRGPPETVLAKATVLLAIATALLAGIAAGQAWILATTDASTRKAADAAVTSAQTAQAALKTAQENFRKEQRPIVWLNDLGTPTFIPNRKTADGTGQIVWSWHFTNYGRSPALHMSFDHFMRIENATEGSYGSVGPSAAAPVPTHKDNFATVVSRPGISLDEFNRLFGTDEAIGVAGEISYFDAYGGKYQTTFCLHHLSSGAIGYCKHGNDIK